MPPAKDDTGVEVVPKGTPWRKRIEMSELCMTGVSGYRLLLVSTVLDQFSPESLSTKVYVEEATQPLESTFWSECVQQAAVSGSCG